MNARIGSVVVMGLAGLSLLGCASQDVKPGPMFVVTTPVVQLSAGATIDMYGTGFAPKQEIMLLFKDPGGGMSGIAGTVAPNAVPNQDGAWAARWLLTPYLSSFRPGTGMLTVTDMNYKTLGQAPVVLLPAPPKPKPEAKPEAKPAAKPAP
jgi:hypothetical protein